MRQEESMIDRPVRNFTNVKDLERLAVKEQVQVAKYKPDTYRLYNSGFHLFSLEQTGKE